MNKNFTKKIVSLASAAAIMGAVAVPTMAATPVEGNTNVYYTNENIVGNGKWGVKIPSGVTFTNASKTHEDPDDQNVKYGITLVSLDPNQKDLRAIYKTLTVSGSVKSKNSFKFEKEGSAGTAVGGYTYQVGDKVSTSATAGSMELPVLDHKNENNGKISYKGKFDLTEKANQEGKYKDTLTFSFTATAEELLG